VVRGVSGLRPTAALLGVGSPLTMYRMGLAKRPIGLPLRSMLTNGENMTPRRNLHKCRYYRRGKWLTPSSQKARRLAHWFPSPMSATPLPARRKAGSYGLLSLLDGKSGNAHIAIARKSRENASGRESGRRRRSNQMLFCNGRDRVKVRQGRLKRTEDQQGNRGKQMTEEGMVPCFPA
jgi:hypothetical protein